MSGGVQSLFGQCPNRACAFSDGASLTRHIEKPREESNILFNIFKVNLFVTRATFPDKGNFSKDDDDDVVDGEDDDEEDPVTTVAIPGVATAVFVAIAGEILRPVVPDTVLRVVVVLMR